MHLPITLFAIGLSYLLNLLQPNLVSWCIILSQAALRDIWNAVLKVRLYSKGSDPEKKSFYYYFPLHFSKSLFIRFFFMLIILIIILLVVHTIIYSKTFSWRSVQIVVTSVVCVSNTVYFLQESLKKFKEETQKLEESEALKKARQKFVSI